MTTVGGVISPSGAADATSPIDYRQRNGSFAPASPVETEKQKPATNEAVQEKRVEKITVEKKASPLLGRKAGIEVTESQPKQVREKDSRRPDVKTQPTSDLNHRPAATSTASGTIKPPLVAKYQDSLAAAPVWGGVRPMDPGTTARINRFVFRKNPTEPSNPANGNPAVPAAGGSIIQK